MQSRETLPQQNDQPVSTISHSQATWPAGLFLGVCMVARGEIGFLIINLASQVGLVGKEAFLISTWAITLNTLIDPASIGIFLKTQVGRSIEQGKWGHMKAE